MTSAEMEKDTAEKEEPEDELEIIKAKFAKLEAEKPKKGWMTSAEMEMAAAEKKGSEDELEIIKAKFATLEKKDKKTTAEESKFDLEAIKARIAKLR